MAPLPQPKHAGRAKSVLVFALGLLLGVTLGSAIFLAVGIGSVAQ